jgi:hypothetical protein
MKVAGPGECAKNACEPAGSGGPFNLLAPFEANGTILVGDAKPARPSVLLAQARHATDSSPPQSPLS